MRAPAGIVFEKMHSTKQRLIDTGLKVLLEQGYNGLGIQALLDATGRPAADLDIRLFRSGSMMIAGIQRQDGAEGARPVELRLPGPLWVRSLRDAAPAVLTDRLVLELGPIEPLLLALSAAPGTNLPIDQSPKITIAIAYTPSTRQLATVSAVDIP